MRVRICLTATTVTTTTTTNAGTAGEDSQTLAGTIQTTGSHRDPYWTNDRLCTENVGGRLCETARLAGSLRMKPVHFSAALCALPPHAGAAQVHKMDTKRARTGDMRPARHIGSNGGELDTDGGRRLCTVGTPASPQCGQRWLYTQPSAVKSLLMAQTQSEQISSRGQHTCIILI